MTPATLKEIKAEVAGIRKRRPLTEHEDMAYRRLHAIIFDLIKAAERRDELIERYTDALEQIETWSRAYPVSVFKKPDLAKAARVLKENGMTLDAISADAMRHVVAGVGEIASNSLAEFLGDE